MTVLEKDQSNPALYEFKQLLVILCCIYLCISLETPVLQLYFILTFGQKFISKRQGYN